MGPVVNVLELLFDYLGIDLRGGYIGMAEHLLNGSEVSAVFKQMSGKGVTESMRCDLLLYSGFLLIGFYYFPESLTGHARAAYIDKERLLVGIGYHIGPDALKILGNGLNRDGIHGAKTLFILAAASDDAGRKVYVA